MSSGFAREGIMKIQAEELRASFALLDHVPQIDMLEASKFIRCTASEKVMQLHLASTLVGFSTIKVKEGTKLRFHLDRNALSGFLKATQGDEIVLQTGAKLVLQQGRNKLEVSTPPSVGGYGVPLDGKSTTLEFAGDEFAPLQTLQKYVPRKAIDERYSALQGLKGFGWMAMDGLVMAVQRGKLERDITLPAALLEAASGDCRFMLYDKTVSYQNGSGTLHQLLHNDLASFPRGKAKEIAENAFAAKPIVEMETSVWQNALQYFQNFQTEGARLECELVKGGLLLKLAAIGMKAETTISAKVIGKSEKLLWDPEKLMPWAASLTSKVIRMAVMENMTVFTTETKRDMLAVVTLSS